MNLYLAGLRPVVVDERWCPIGAGGEYRRIQDDDNRLFGVMLSVRTECRDIAESPARAAIGVTIDADENGRDVVRVHWTDLHGETGTHRLFELEAGWNLTYVPGEGATASVITDEGDLVANILFNPSNMEDEEHPDYNVFVYVSEGGDPVDNANRQFFVSMHAPRTDPAMTAFLAEIDHLEWIEIRDQYWLPLSLGDITLVNAVENYVSMIAPSGTHVEVPWVTPGGFTLKYGALNDQRILESSDVVHISIGHSVGGKRITIDDQLRELCGWG